ncbi:CRP-like cAMP-binding protein [Pedobacter sp. UYP24]
MKRTCILLIEDNDDIRESAAEILTLANYEVLEARNGKIGVELSAKHLPDLILCDIMMPELDGYGVLHLLGKNPETAVIPFIFITAKTERQDMRKGMEMGADDYLTKPFDDVELFNAIESRLKKKDILAESYSKSLDNLNSIIDGKGMEELKSFIAARKIRNVKKKQIIYYEGDTVNGIYLVTAGKVKAFKVADDGRELLIGMYAADEYFGVAALLAGENYTDTTEAVENTSICLLPKELMDRLLNKFPDVASRFIKILANNVLDKEQQLLQLAYHSVRKRMAEVIIRLENVNLGANNNTLDISRDNLAAMAGIATETVSRMLSDFKDEGLIERKGSYITVLNHVKLENMKN